MRGGVVGDVMVAKGPFDLLRVGGWGSTSSSLPVDDHAAVIDLDDVGGPTGVVDDRDDCSRVERHRATCNAGPDAVAHVGTQGGPPCIVARVVHLQGLAVSWHGGFVELVDGPRRRASALNARVTFAISRETDCETTPRTPSTVPSPLGPCEGPRCSRCGLRS